MDGIKDRLRSLHGRIWSSSTEKADLRFQFMSDLHLEVGQQSSSFTFATTAPYLILGGDIGRLVDYDGYLSFLKDQTNRYDRVFLVLGNHEFYGLDFPTGLATARRLEQEAALEGKLVLLQQNSVYLTDGPKSIAVLGCPLWSFIPGESSRAVASAVNDFKKIDGWGVEKHNAAHAQDPDWLRKEVTAIQSRDTEMGIIIVTHHAPVVEQTASPQHQDSPIQSAFSTDICNTGELWRPVKYWMFGHTHWTTHFRVNGIQLVSNQRGYIFPGSARLRVQKQLSKHTFESARTIQI